MIIFKNDKIVTTFVKNVINETSNNRIIGYIKQKKYNYARYMVSEINDNLPKDTKENISTKQILNSIEDYFISKIEE